MSAFFRVSGSDSGVVTDQSGNQIHGPGARSFGPWTINGGTEVGVTLNVALASGDNTIAIPAGAVAVALLPQPGGPAMTLRTSSDAGDAGIPLGVAGSGAQWDNPNAQPLPFVYPFPLSSPPTTLIVHAAAGGGSVQVVFI